MLQSFHMGEHCQWHSSFNRASLVIVIPLIQIIRVGIISFSRPKLITNLYSFFFVLNKFHITKEKIDIIYYLFSNKKKQLTKHILSYLNSGNDTYLTNHLHCNLESRRAVTYYLNFF